MAPQPPKAAADRSRSSAAMLHMTAYYSFGGWLGKKSAKSDLPAFGCQNTDHTSGNEAILHASPSNGFRDDREPSPLSRWGLLQCNKFAGTPTSRVVGDVSRPVPSAAGLGHGSPSDGQRSCHPHAVDTLFLCTWRGVHGFAIWDLICVHIAFRRCEPFFLSLPSPCHRCRSSLVRPLFPGIRVKDEEDESHYFPGLEKHMD